ncbi:MAG: hypothetical protein MRY83_18855 [Flavobacteriales bacterium]|nr:hypothetical protein [Flavobacteriales bacterium]
MSKSIFSKRILENGWILKKRKLSNLELEEAQKVFGQLNWSKIRILENSSFAHLGKWFAGKTQLGVSLIYTIHFTRVINCMPGNFDMAWLIHELTHVWQFENIGIRYIPQALYAQHFTKDKYDYGGKSALFNRQLLDFNVEQQAEIAKDYYLSLFAQKPNTIFEQITGVLRQ